MVFIIFYKFIKFSNSCTSFIMFQYNYYCNKKLLISLKECVCCFYMKATIAIILTISRLKIYKNTMLLFVYFGVFRFEI